MNEKGLWPVADEGTRPNSVFLDTNDSQLKTHSKRDKPPSEWISFEGWKWSPGMRLSTLTIKSVVLNALLLVLWWFHTDILNILYLLYEPECT